MVEYEIQHGSTSSIKEQQRQRAIRTDAGIKSVEGLASKARTTFCKQCTWGKASGRHVCGTKRC